MLAPLVLAASLATAQTNVHALKEWSLGDSIASGSGLVLWLGTELLKPALAPPACRWCDADATGADALNAFDAWGRGVRWSLASQNTADFASTLSLVALVPLGLGANWWLASREGSSRAAIEDTLIVAEAVVFAADADQLVKFLAGRQRPFVHVLPAAQKLATSSPSDNNLSFFSGHTTLAFALMVGLGTVAELRGYRDAWIFWAIGVPLACVVPYLRMAADKHYLTDVIAGAAIGSAFGWWVPRWLHPRIGGAGSWSLSLSPGGAAIQARF